MSMVSAAFDRLGAGDLGRRPVNHDHAGEPRQYPVPATICLLRVTANYPRNMSS